MLNSYNLLDYLYMNWLRPEGVVWDTTAAQLFGKQLLNGAGDILEIGIGNGYTSFMQLGGKFDPVYDWYYNVSPDGFEQNKDIYDVTKIQSIEKFIIQRPKINLVAAIDHKQNLLNQVIQLGFVKNIVLHDANQPIETIEQQFDTITSNILYWLDDPLAAIRDWTTKCKENAKIVLCFPNPRFYEYCTSYTSESSLWIKLNRGRKDCVAWCLDLDEFSKQVKAETDLKMVDSQTYLSRKTLEIWDVGLRPLSPALIKMANYLDSRQRLEIKKEWCDLCLPFAEELLENELHLGPKEGAYNFVTLSF